MLTFMEMMWMPASEGSCLFLAGQGKAGDQRGQGLTVFSTGKGENRRPIHKLPYIFINSGSCHFLDAFYLEDACPQASAVSDMMSECLYFGMPSAVTLPAYCLTRPAKSLRWWQHWTSLTINLTLNKFVLYFLKASLPVKLPSNYWEKIANREYVSSGYYSVSEKRKKIVCLVDFYSTNNVIYNGCGLVVWAKHLKICIRLAEG